MSDVLRQRYQRSQIYSFVGAMLLVVNPFRDLKLVTTERCMRCHQRGPETMVYFSGSFRGSSSASSTQNVSIYERSTIQHFWRFTLLSLHHFIIFSRFFQSSCFFRVTKRNFAKFHEWQHDLQTFREKSRSY